MCWCDNAAIWGWRSMRGIAWRRFGCWTRTGSRFGMISGEVVARRVILYSGGRSWPGTGSNGRGLEIARSLGHTGTELYWAPVLLVLRKGFFHVPLAGLDG